MGSDEKSEGRNVVPRETAMLLQAACDQARAERDAKEAERATASKAWWRAVQGRTALRAALTALRQELLNHAADYETEPGSRLDVALLLRSMAGGLDAILAGNAPAGVALPDWAELADQLETEAQAAWDKSTVAGSGMGLLDEYRWKRDAAERIRKLCVVDRRSVMALVRRFSKAVELSQRARPSSIEGVVERFAELVAELRKVAGCTCNWKDGGPCLSCARLDLSPPPVVPAACKACGRFAAAHGNGRVCEPPVVPAGDSDVTDPEQRAEKWKRLALAAEKRAEMAEQEREAFEHRMTGAHMALHTTQADRNALVAKLRSLAAHWTRERDLLPEDSAMRAEHEGRRVAYDYAEGLVATLGTGTAPGHEGRRVAYDYAEGLVATLGTGTAPAEAMVPAASVEALADTLTVNTIGWPPGVLENERRKSGRERDEEERRIVALYGLDRDYSGAPPGEKGG